MPPLKTQLIQDLEKIPGLTHQEWPEREDGFSTLHYQDREIAHFHNFSEIDIRLGKALIKQECLKHNPASKTHPKRSPNSQFIEMTFGNRQDIDEIIRLIKLAIAATG